MANVFAQIDLSGIDELQQKMDQYGEGSGQVINEYLKDDGFKRIGTHIHGLIHGSGRRWKGKATSAARADYTAVFQGDTYGMTLTVRSRSRYGYLYFPDDGSNSIRHAGGQQFMKRGAEGETDEIAKELVNRLVAAFEEA